MRRIGFCAVLLFLPLLCLAAAPALRLLGKSKSSSKPFVINVHKPFVCVRFDHIGPGKRRSEEEPLVRMWLHPVNDCRVPITVTAIGIPDESPKNELALR